HDDSFRTGRILSIPVIVLAGSFGLWTQLAYGKPWTWAALAVAVVALLASVALMWRKTREGVAFTAMVIVVAAVAALIFGSMYPT
ncbi:cytochrome d ubiquinol oxidase subunit II, partial [Mycobacterium sp. ITM-2017-0098]